MNSTVGGDQALSINIRALGGFSLAVGDDGVPEAAFARKKARSLVKLLAIQPACRLHREQVLEALWPHLPPPAAAAQFYKALHQARQALSFTRLHDTEERGLRLHEEILELTSTGGVITDLEVFERLADESFASDNLETLRECIRAYAGDLLPEDRFEEWALEKREALRERYVSVLVELGRRLLERDMIEDAIPPLSHAVEIDPSCEQAHQHLMRAFGAQGNAARVQRQYERCRQALLDALGVEPSAQTSALLSSIQRTAVTPTPRGEPSTQPRQLGELPIPALPLLGREHELPEILIRLRDPSCRLLSLVGPGGIGKTRLAIEVARSLQREGMQMYWVPVSPLGSVAELPRAVADHVGYAPSGRDDLTRQLLDHLRSQQAVLVLDSFEHLLDGAGVLQRIHEHAPEIRMLVTSRERLHLEHEWVYAVAGLVRDAGPNEAADALRLFDLVARQRGRPCTSDHEQKAAVEVCTLLHGNPLAIELAASWTSTLPVPEILVEIRSNLDFLVSSSRHVPERHRSLRATFEHSWVLLGSQERRVLRSLGIFRGPFTRAEAQAVARASLHDLVTLTDKSLLACVHPNRFVLHETVRHYALERLAAHDDEHQAISARYVEHFASWCEHVTSLLKGPSLQEGLTSLEQGYVHLTDSWKLAISHENIRAISRIAEGIWLLGDIRGRFAEVRDLLALADGLKPKTPSSQEHSLALGRVFCFWSLCENRLGEHSTAHALALRALTCAQAASSDDVAAMALHALGVALAGLGSYAHAGSMLSYSVQAFRQGDDRWREAHALLDLGSLEHLLGAQDQAARWHRDALTILRDLGERRGEAMALRALGEFELLQRRPEEARALLARSLAIQRDLNDPWGSSDTLGSLARAALLENSFEEAVEFASGQLSVRRQLGNPKSIAAALDLMGHVRKSTGDLSTAMELFSQSLALRESRSDKVGVAASLNLMASISRAAGERERAAMLAHESRSIRLAAGGKLSAAAALGRMGSESLERGEIDEAQQQLYDSLSISRDIGDRWGIAVALNRLGQLQTHRGSYAQARALHRHAGVMFSDLGDDWGVATSALLGASSALYLGERPRTPLEQAQAIFASAGDSWGVASVTLELGRAAFCEQDQERALQLLTDALAGLTPLKFIAGMTTALLLRSAAFQALAIPAEAREDLKQAIQVAYSSRQLIRILDVLAHCGPDLVSEGALPLGAQVLGTAARHPASSAHARAVAERSLERLEERFGHQPHADLTGIASSQTVAELALQVASILNGQVGNAVG